MKEYISLGMIPRLATSINQSTVKSLDVLQLPVQQLWSRVMNEMQQNPLLEPDESTPEEWYIKNLPPADTGDALTWDNVPAPRPGLVDHLLSELNLADVGQTMQAVGTYIVYHLDENGYLDVEISEIARECGVSARDAVKALQIIQKLGPPGIGARNLKECLLLQVDPSHSQHALVVQLINHHLDDLARGRIRKIARRLDVTEEQVAAAVKVIRSLEPKPGRRYNNTAVPFIIPDAVITKSGKDYQVVVNNAGPRLRLNERYISLLKKPDLDDAARSFLRDKLDAARVFIKSIERRQQTLQRVLELLIVLQRDFLDFGPAGLIPLTMNQVAHTLDLHVSTVSRAAAHKYVQTPRGIYALKVFFPRGGDGEVSADTIQEKIKAIVSRENPASPFSDENIVQLLKQYGISVSRRTVAKYRKKMQIPPAFKRRHK
ncbi:MAG: RNA polymerase factor sigma-54 [Peptococcaceae bacterium]|nr:RNA polymerase factor sigma-54 [Peptococcaceae bacterium]